MSQIDQKNLTNNSKDEKTPKFVLLNVITVGLLFLINLLNYMDRLIIAGKNILS